MRGRGKVKGRDAKSFEERRTDPRFSLVMRTAKLLCESGEYVCTVRDISAGGTKLGLFHDLPPDTHLFLELANGDRYAMERRWHCGDRAGFRFASPIDVNEFIDEPSRYSRRPLRLRVHKPALVTVDDRDSRAMLVNLSQQGACIEAGRKLAVGERFRLDIYGLPLRFGQVCWRRKYTHGLVFQQGFRLDEFARHLYALQPFASALSETMSSHRRRAARFA